MKRILMVMLIIFIAVAMMFAGCATPDPTTTTTTQTQEPGDTETTAEEPAGNLNPPGTLPLVNEPVTLEVMFQTPTHVEDLYTNEQTKWVEEVTNLRFEWIQVSGPDAGQQVSLKLSSGDLPDIFFSCWLSQVQELQYGVREQVLIPLNDYIDNSGYHIKQRLDQFPELRMQMTAPDGNIYALAELLGPPEDPEEFFHIVYGNKYWINQAWLANLDLPMPTTTEEFYQTMLAFKNDDPNNTNQADTYPIIATSWSNPIGFLMSAFIYDDGSPSSWPRHRRMQVVNGQVSSILDQPEFREGLAYMNKLYSDGLIYEASFTQNSEQARALTTADPSIVGGYQMMAPFWITPQEAPLYRELTAMPPLKGPGGLQVAGTYGYQPDTGQFAITIACDEPDVAFAFADFCYSPEFFMWSTHGQPGVNWREAESNELNYQGKPALFALPEADPALEDVFQEGAETQNIRWDKGFFFGTIEMFLTGRVAAPDFDLYAPTSGEEFLHEMTKVYDGYGASEYLPPVIRFLVEESERLAIIETELDNYVREAELNFIMGVLDTESDWDAYVDNLHRLGLLERNEIYQTAYDRMSN